MLTDLATVMSVVSKDARRVDFVNAIVESNCLGKPTASTRRLTAQRLSELYALDPSVAIFRVFRNLWDKANERHRLLALLLAIGRDPLLAATAPAVLALPAGTELQRDSIRDALQRLAGDRFNPAILDKVVRNTASSWTQSGHLEGRTFKRRRLVRATTLDAVFALYLAYVAGFRGAELFQAGWFKVLDCTPDQARNLAMEAKRVALIDLRVSGDVVDINLGTLDPWSSRGVRNVPY